jgi:hypothetical protein
MVRFHQHLVAGADPAEALRRAQLDVLADTRWRHPFYWAPFVVIGDVGWPPATEAGDAPAGLDRAPPPSTGR